MPSNLGSERLTVQGPLIRYTVEIGWAYLPPEEALTLRRGESGTLLYQTLHNKLVALNPVVVTVDNAGQVIARIRCAHSVLHVSGQADAGSHPPAGHCSG